MVTFCYEKEVAEQLNNRRLPGKCSFGDGCDQVRAEEQCSNGRVSKRLWIDYADKIEAKISARDIIEKQYNCNSIQVDDVLTNIFVKTKPVENPSRQGRDPILREVIVNGVNNERKLNIRQNFICNHRNLIAGQITGNFLN